MPLLVDSGVGIGRKLVVKVKIARATTICYIDPLCGTKSNIIFDKKIELSWKLFWENYGICNEDITPKRLKIGKEIEEEEVVALFGPYSCNNIATLRMKR